MKLKVNTILIQLFLVETKPIIVAPTLAYFLPMKYYGEQISLALEGPFLEDEVNSKHQMTLSLHSGSVSNEVNHEPLS